MVFVGWYDIDALNRPSSDTIHGNSTIMSE